MADSRRRIFCFPGLGADARMYHSLTVNGYDKVALNWVVPYPGESLKAYTARLLQPYKPTPNDCMLGVSFGGPVAVEAARSLGGVPTILISTIKYTSEKPPYFHFFRKVPLQKYIPARWIKRAGTTVPPPQRAGMGPDEYELFLDMVAATNEHFMRWGIQQILHWTNDRMPGPYLHLHGDRDLLFPCSCIHRPVVIQGGTHFMIVRQISTINAHIQAFLDKTMNTHTGHASKKTLEG